KDQGGAAVAQRALAVNETVEREGVSVDPATVATIASRAGEYKKAVELWDRLGQIDTPDYRRARARIEPFPRNLEWLARGREHDQIVEQWRANAAGPGTVPEETLRLV